MGRGPKPPSDRAAASPEEFDLLVSKLLRRLQAEVSPEAHGAVSAAIKQHRALAMPRATAAASSNLVSANASIDAGEPAKGNGFHSDTASLCRLEALAAGALGRRLVAQSRSQAEGHCNRTVYPNPKRLPQRAGSSDLINSIATPHPIQLKSDSSNPPRDLSAFRLSAGSSSVLQVAAVAL